MIDAVSKFAREEFQAAGRCLAFGLYSASGFHSARAVETVLRDYHHRFLPAQKSDDMTMGRMASALDNMHSAKEKAKHLPRENPVRHLRDFTSYDRNPLIHKTVVLEEIDAVTLFSAAASVIVEMAKELRGEKPHLKDDAAKPALLEEANGPANALLAGVADEQPS